MAETKQEKKTFKWGDNEYLLDDLLKLHAEQEQNFYNFAKVRGQYDDNALAGLRTAISNRIGAVKNGQAFDADGVLESDVVDNVSIQTQKKGLFKKDKYVDQDNTEWAKYYLNKLVRGLKPHQKEEIKDSGKWDINKYGLDAYLTGQGLKAQDIFENYDLRNETNPDAARSYTQRDELLRKHLTNYQAWLKNKGFDFTKNDDEWDDDYMSTLEGVINGNWDDRTSLAASLRKLGSGNYAIAFTSDKWDLSKSNDALDAERKAAADKKKKEEIEKAWNDEKARRYGVYSGLGDLRSGQMTQYMGKDRIFDLTDEDIDYHMQSQKISGTDAEKKYWDDLDFRYKNNPYDVSVAQLVLPMKARQGVLKSIDSGDYKGWNYDPTTINDERQSVMAFDPITGKMEEIFVGHLVDDWTKIKNQFMKEQGHVDPLASFAKEGGVLSFQTGGSLSSYDYIQSYKKDKNTARAEETGNSEEVQKARDRVVSNGDEPLAGIINKNKGEQASLAQPKAGFTGAEKARLASIGMDIASIFLDPITGLATNAVSTFTNLGADIGDDGFQWQDVKNFGINLGFDLLGAIPIFGDAFGTGAKITKNLIKWAPRVMSVLATYQGTKNFDGIMDSWGKITSGDKDKKMTVQDWRNIAQSISLLTGGVRAARNKAAQSKMKRQARIDDAVGVNVRNKDTGKLEQVIVDGDVAKNIRAAKGDRAKIEAELSKLDDFNGKFGETGTLEVATKSGGLQKPWTKHEAADGSGSTREWRGFASEGRAQVSDVYDFKKAKGYGDNWGIKIPGVSNRLSDWHKNLMAKTNAKLNPTTVDQRGKMSNEAFEAEQTRLLNDQGVEAQIGKVKAAVEARNKSLAKTDEFISKAQSDLEVQQRLAGGDDLVARQADAEARLRGLSSKDAINNARNTVAHHTATIARNKAKRTSLSESRSKQLTQMEEGLNAKVTTKKADIDALRARQKAIKRKLADGKSHPKLEAELKQVNSKIRKLNAEYKTLQRDVPIQIAEARARIESRYQKAYTQLGASTRSAKGAIATAQPIAAQRKAYNEAYAQQQAAISGQTLQQRLNTLQGRRSAHDPATAHTHAYKELETMLNNLRTSNPTIGGKAVNWDMDAILQRYGVNATDVFEQGGSINRNKINKFLTYAKG